VFIVYNFENKLFMFSDTVWRTCSFWEVFLRHCSFEVFKSFCWAAQSKVYLNMICRHGESKMSSCFKFQTFTVIKIVLLSIKYNISTQESPDTKIFRNLKRLMITEFLEVVIHDCCVLFGHLNYEYFIVSYYFVTFLSIYVIISTWRRSPKIIRVWKVLHKFRYCVCI
jgi:hypothetical protein